MKTIALFLFCLLTISVSAHTIQIDERKVDIYFGNGVWNDDQSAETGRKELEDTIKAELNRPYETVTLAFNHTYGKRRDLIETFYQLKELGQISAGYFHVLSNIMTPEYLIFFQDIYLSGVVSE